MRVLFQSDLQADFSNLQECEIALEELLEAAAKYKPDVIIHGGDVKDAYSPVDVEVVKFCVRMVRRIREAGHRFIILLGNHDRISQSAESRNWLDVLQAAGAEVVTEPKAKIVQGVAVAFLPFMAVDGLIPAAAALHRAILGHTGPKLLVFHCEVAGVLLNAAGRLGKGPTPEELFFGDYDACLGGHIHSHQRISDNGWYIGAPFCQNWGDVNSSRGHLLVDVGLPAISADMVKRGYKAAHDRVVIKQLRTKIPHWYDVEYLDANKITPEPGAYIRSKVRVTSKRLTDQLREEEERIRKAYGDVRIHTVPELIDDASTDVILKGATDREKVEQYVAATITEEHRFEPAQAVSYMLSKLTGLKEAAVGGELHFIGVEAENVLVFEKVKMRLDKLGLVLIRGENLDWPGRSNGTGKTSTLSLIPIAMFGEVPNKKQKADDWAYERNEESAKIRLLVRDAAGRKIEITRSRRPHSIGMRIDGDDKSSGIRGTGRDETQGLIERVTGYDMQMLMNAVYIDQAVANGFVFGTPKGRMDLINRFQNLERFEKALELVAKDQKKWDAALVQLSANAEMLEQEIDGLNADLVDLKAETESNWAAQLDDEKKVLDNLIQQHAAVTATAQMYEDLQRTLDDLGADERRESGEYERLSRLSHVLNEKLTTGRKLLEAGKCPTCSQPTKKVGADMMEQNKKAGQEAFAQAGKHLDAVKQITDKVASIEKKISSYADKKRDLAQQISRSRLRLTDLQQAADEEAERNQARAVKLEKKEWELAVKKRFRRAAVAARQDLAQGLEMLEYAKKAFHRSGIPLYLSVALCPLLNRAADEYSEVFTDGNLKVSFRVEDGEFVVDVVNPAGSSTTKGQSEGESAMAGLITAFSLREAAPKTNMLILDEPGAKLDPEGCKQFARGILRLKERFETILLVTHSPYISSLLSGETVYTIIKKNGRSRLCLSSAKENGVR